jgi:glycosyltransferase involved in cell wall biosynthesis
MKICLLDKTNFEYSFKDKYSEKLRGAETIIVNLYQQLHNLGHEVYAFNNCSENINNENNTWFNINKLNLFNNINFDIAISNADARLFNNINAKKKFLISYSIQSLEKFIRKGQIFAYLKHKPTILVISKYHKSVRSKITSLFGVKIFDLCVDDIFINTKLTNDIDNNLAIFTSRPDRNSSMLLEIWNNEIQPKHKYAKLLLNPKIKNNFNPNILERTLGSQQNLINDLLKSRIFLIPGHKAELYCFAAEEARELCIPIVTLGIGSLKERVVHEKTGFIAKNKKEFADYTLELFFNNQTWTEIRNNLITMRNSNNWAKATKNLLNIL